MSVALWLEVFALRDRVDRATERAAHQLRTSSSDVEATSRSALILSTLHMDVRHALERSMTTAFDVPARRGDADHFADRALRLISFWLNERIRRRLPPRGFGPVRGLQSTGSGTPPPRGCIIVQIRGSDQRPPGVSKCTVRTRPPDADRTHGLFL